MQGIVSSKPEIEDSKTYRQKTRKALRLLTGATLLLGGGGFLFFNEAAPVPITTDFHFPGSQMFGIGLAVIGIVLGVWGLVTLPRVKYPPSSIIR